MGGLKTLSSYRSQAAPIDVGDDMTALDVVLEQGIRHTALGDEMGDDAEDELFALRAVCRAARAFTVKCARSGGLTKEQQDLCSALARVDQVLRRPRTETPSDE